MEVEKVPRKVELKYREFFVLSQNSGASIDSRGLAGMSSI